MMHVFYYPKYCLINTNECEIVWQIVCVNGLKTWKDTNIAFAMVNFNLSCCFKHLNIKIIC